MKDPSVHESHAGRSLTLIGKGPDSEPGASVSVRPLGRHSSPRCPLLGSYRSPLLNRTQRAKAVLPAKRAAVPRYSSNLRSWLYLAVRSERAGAPVLIWPAPVATARSAIE